MTTYRRYRFEHVGEWNADFDAVVATLERQCKKRWWYTDPWAGGQGLARLQFSFTVAGRDQWWCHRRAMFLAGVCYMAAGLQDTKLPEPTWEPLAPHTQRGRFRRPKKTEPASASD
jgi:hypothetical protein